MEEYINERLLFMSLNCVVVDFEFWSVALRKKEAPARKQPREVPAADTFKNETKQKFNLNHL